MKGKSASGSFSEISDPFAEQQFSALVWAASDTVLPQDISCCSIRNRKTSSVELEPINHWKMIIMAKEKWKECWSVALLAPFSLGADLLFYTHEENLPSKYFLLLWGLHRKLIIRSTSRLINWVSLLVWNKTYSPFVNYGNDICPWCCSVDFSRHMIFMNCISGPGWLQLQWLGTHGASLSLVALPFLVLSSPCWVGSEVPAHQLPSTHHGVASDAIQTPSCTVVSVLASPIPLFIPTFPPFFSFFLLHLLPSSLSLVVTHSYAPAITSFSRLLGPRFWRPC